MHGLRLAWGRIKATSSNRAVSRALSNGYALTAAICLAASFLNFLNHNAYPAFRVEVGISFLILALIAISFGFICDRLKPRERFLFSTLFVVLVVQMNLDGSALLVAATVAAAVFLGNYFLSFTSITFTVVLMLQVAEAIVPPSMIAPAAGEAGSEPRPIIVHVVLDAAIGIEGMPDDMPEAVSAADWGREWLIGKGFAVFGRAYSEHLHTVNSVPHMLGFGIEGDVDKEGHDYSLGANRYMAELKKRGYAITVYQNSVADYCGSSQAETCWKASGYRALAQSVLSPYEKLRVLMPGFIALSAPLDFSARVYDLVIASWPALAKIVRPLNWENCCIPTPLGAMEALGELTGRIANGRAGEAHFAHVLLPHSPYAYDSGCVMKPLVEWKGQGAPLRSRHEIYSAYLGQWRCAVLRIGELVDALQESRPDNDFIVIVHGDHGSRITPAYPTTGTVGGLSPQHFRDSYSTLLAILMPGLAPGYRRGIVSVQDVLQDIVSAEFRGPFTPRTSRRPSVLLTGPFGLSPEEPYTIPQLFDED